MQLRFIIVLSNRNNICIYLLTLSEYWVDHVTSVVSVFVFLDCWGLCLIFMIQFFFFFYFPLILLHFFSLTLSCCGGDGGGNCLGFVRSHIWSVVGVMKQSHNIITNSHFDIHCTWVVSPLVPNIVRNASEISPCFYSFSWTLTVHSFPLVLFPQFMFQIDSSCMH
jgi:hypothetical protein